MIRAIQRLGALAAVVAVLLLGAHAVDSHAGYERSEPGRNEMVPDAPNRVDVWFTQDVVKRDGLFYVRVFDEAGVQVSEGDGMVDDDDRTHMSTDLPAGLATGRYVVEWMTTSDTDGDDDEGAFCYYVGVDPTLGQQAECAVFDEDVPPTPTERAEQPTIEPTTDVAPTVIAPPGGDSEGGGSNTGIIVGIIVGLVVVVLAGAGAFVWLRRP